MIQQLCAKEVLLEAAKEVFESMIFMDIKPSSESDQKVSEWTILGSITFKGAFEGSLAFCCGISCAQAIAGNMLGLDTTENLSEEETCDDIGEVINMVMGSIKKRLNDELGNIKVSIPTVVTDRGVRYNLDERATIIYIEVNIDAEYPACFTLSYRKNNKAVEELTKQI